MKLEDISPEQWNHVASALKRYFTGRVHDPEEQAQETVSRVLHKLCESGLDLDGEDAFQKYCFGFARNVLKEARKDQVRSSPPLPSEAPMTEHKTHGLNALESASLLRQALSTLPGETLELLENAERMTLDELVVLYRVPRSVVTVRLFRARKRLRRTLTELLGGENR